MSIFRSYFRRNNTLISNAFTNTGRNPVTELSIGSTGFTIPSFDFSRFIFDLDLDKLNDAISEGYISTGCGRNIAHHLKMTNTASFEEDLLNTKTWDGKRRATSFDLILFRIPKTSGDTGQPQLWDEGVGYDYNDLKFEINYARGDRGPLTFFDDRSYSVRPSNWYQTTTVSNWSEPGIYNNRNLGSVNFNDLHIIDTQHFELGNEDIYFNMTDEINGILNGAIEGNTGWGIAFMPEFENITGFTEPYCVGFFTRHTQTFYEPFLETRYDDWISDDRNNFVKNRTNKLYLYVYENGDFVNLDFPPIVNIFNPDDDLIIPSLSSCSITRGIYEVTIPNQLNSYPTPCEFSDVWTNLSINGQPISDITNNFILKDSSSRLTIGTQSKDPEIFGFDFYGIKQNEKVLNTDIRKVGVIIKKAFTTSIMLDNIDAYYRIYVREGMTEVQVQDWTKINRTPNEFYFIFDTRDKIPNEYYVDIKVNINGQRDTYKRELTFLIVNKK